VVIAGRYRGDDLVVVARTVPLRPEQSAELGELLRPAKPGHPWPDETASRTMNASIGDTVQDENSQVTAAPTPAAQDNDRLVTRRGTCLLENVTRAYNTT
jgi:hypothetical protein